MPRPYCARHQKRAKQPRRKTCLKDIIRSFGQMTEAADPRSGSAASERFLI